MREILFRGKTNKGEWVQGYLLYDNEQNEGYIAESFEDRAAYIREINPKTIGQYTGLNAKNGTKIFEGDIVKSEIGTYVVKFLTGSWCCSLIEREYLTLLSIISVKEIIGNIHDNPELLKRSDNNAKEKE
jgi:uncharacterized phage protein (TIGR01671 family)